MISNDKSLAWHGVTSDICVPVGVSSLDNKLESLYGVSQSGGSYSSGNPFMASLGQGIVEIECGVGLDLWPGLELWLE